MYIWYNCNFAVHNHLFFGRPKLLSNRSNIFVGFFLYRISLSWLVFFFFWKNTFRNFQVVTINDAVLRLVCILLAFKFIFLNIFVVATLVSTVWRQQVDCSTRLPSPVILVVASGFSCLHTVRFNLFFLVSQSFPPPSPTSLRTIQL